MSRITRIIGLALIIVAGLVCSTGVGAEETSSDAVSLDRSVVIAISKHPRVKALVRFRLNPAILIVTFALLGLLIHLT